MKKLAAIGLVLLLLAPGLLACGQAEASVVRSAKKRITSPQVSKTDEQALVAGNNAFAVSLYQSLRSQSGNMFFSPFSVSMALAMTYAGARGDTEAQMANALRFTLPQDRLHPAFNALDLALNSRAKDPVDPKAEAFKLSIVNAIWGQKGYSFLPEYLDTLAQNYDAGLRILDFEKSPDESRVTINDWVAEQTANRIKDLLPAGSVNHLTRLVLTNAIYFKASWLHQFDKDVTQNGTFHLQNGGTVTVPMMKQEERFNYAEGQGYQAVELPYVGRQLSMVILLPESGNFSAFENALTPPRLEGIINDLDSRQVNLTMPKFTFESSFGLKSALSAMGMPVAFTQNANFSGMSSRGDLQIQDVVHKAFVAVDENGTEAAAATGVIVGVTSLPPTPVDVTIDRPFVFLIRDIPTGAVLFLGRVINPAP